MESPSAARHRNYVDQLTAICADVGAAIQWHSDEWIAEIKTQSKRVLVIGQVFPLSNASAAHVANDKVATFHLLAAAGLPAVPHHLMRFPMAADLAVRCALSQCDGLPIVIKPHRESGGIDVRRTSNKDELCELLDYYAAKYRAIAVSPWQEVQDEHRIVVLDDIPLLVYRKDLSGSGEWRHNLQFGARAALDVGAVRNQLEDVARAAMCALDLRFASVDVIRVGGQPLVLEVNGGVTLEHFGRTSDRHRRLADEVYRRAICVSLGL